MTGVISFENITFVIALGGVAFGVYHFFRNPDIEADKSLCILKEMLASSQEKNDLLLDIQKNHLHTLELTQQCTDKNVQELKIEVSNLATIINERIPKK